MGVDPKVGEMTQDTTRSLQREEVGALGWTWQSKFLASARGLEMDGVEFCRLLYEVGDGRLSL